MEFTDGAAFFNNDQVFDAYSGAFLFMGHTTAHDDHTSSGATSRRRTLIAAVDAVAPARRAIRWYGTYWIIGGNNTDGFLGQEVRRNFGLKKSSGLMVRMSPGGVVVPSSSFHAHKEYYRDMADALTSAEMDVMWNIFCPKPEPVVKGDFLMQGATVFRVRNVYESADEFLIAEADQFDADTVQTAVFTGPAALEFTVGVTPGTVTTTVFQTDASKFYLFHSAGEAGTQPGDRAVFVARAAVTPVVGGFMRMLGTNWRIVTKTVEGDAWVLKVRLV